MPGGSTKGPCWSPGIFQAGGQVRWEETVCDGAGNCLSSCNDTMSLHILCMSGGSLHLSSSGRLRLIGRPPKGRVLPPAAPPSPSPCNCAAGGTGPGDGATCTSHYLPLGSLRLQTAIAHVWILPLHGRMSCAAGLGCLSKSEKAVYSRHIYNLVSRGHVKGMESDIGKR